MGSSNYKTDVAASDELLQFYETAKKLRKQFITCARDLEEKFLDLHLLSVEQARIAFLDNRNRIIETSTRTGTVDHCTVYTREIAKQALMCDAASVIMAHNHPGGSPIPSEADKNITKNLKAALKLFEIELVDHIIFFGEGTTSMRATSNIW